MYNLQLKNLNLINETDLPLDYTFLVKFIKI